MPFFKKCMSFFEMYIYICEDNWRILWDVYCGFIKYSSIDMIFLARTILKHVKKI